MVAVAREHTVPGWAELEAELDAWVAAGRHAAFWWMEDHPEEVEKLKAQVFKK